MSNGDGVLETVRQAILVAASPTASSPLRKQAALLLDQVKAGEAHVAVTLASSLVGAEEVEVQHFGYMLLQYMVGVRWEEFNGVEKEQLATFAFQLFQKGAGEQTTWAVRSKAAVLLALVAKRQGPELWVGMLPSLASFSQSGPVPAQMVCLVLQYLSDEVVQFNEDLENDARRVLLSGLQSSLDLVLPLLASLLERHLGMAAEAERAGDAGKAQAHAAVVATALGTTRSYTEWVPLLRVASSGLLGACCYLVCTPEYCIAAMEILKTLFSRKNTAEEAEQLASMMVEPGQALIRLSSQVLSPAVRPQLEYKGPLEQVGLTLAESMAMFGSKYFSVLPQGDRLTFLQEMLSLMESPFMLLSAKTHPFWINMLKSTAATTSLPQECVTRVIDLAGDQLRAGARLVAQDGDVPPYFDEFEEYKRTALDFRSSLLEIVRWAALRLPEEVLAIVARRLGAATLFCSSSSSPVEDQQTQYESAVYFMESVVLAWNPNPKAPAAAMSSWPPPQGVQDGFRVVLLGLLGARLRPDPHLLSFHARALEAFARYLELAPDLVPPLINKVFDMFTYVSLEGDPKGAPPGDPSPDWKDRFSARQRVATVLVNIARISPKVLVPQLSGQATRIRDMSAAGLLWRGESNVLSDGLLAASVGATPQVQGQVANWILSPVREEWARPAWQAQFQSPEAFIQHFMPLSYRSDGTLEVGGGLARWALYHDLHIIERSAKRLPASPAFRGGPWSPESVQHPLNQHVDWIAAPLLQIVVCLHSVWSRESREALAAVSSALDIGPKEKALYLKKSVKDAPAQAGESESTTLGGNSQAALRSWLRQVRELLYQACGDFCSQVGGWYGSPAAQALWPVALIGSLPIMEDWQLRLLLRHTIIVLVRSCPPSQRTPWLLPILAPLLPHLRSRLSTAWGIFLSTRGEAAAASGGPSMENAQAADVEVIAERQMRELTQETLFLLEVLKGDPAKGTAGASNGNASVLEWLVNEDPSTLHVAAALATDALRWPDDVSLSRAAAFCRALIPHAQRDSALEEWVSHTMLKSCFGALTYVSGNVLKAEVMHLARDLILRSLPIPPGPRQELLLLPLVNEQVLATFEAEIRSTGSEKEQRQLVKKLLQSSGDMKLQAALSETANGRTSIPQLAEPRPHARIASLDEQGGSLNVLNEDAVRAV